MNRNPNVRYRWYHYPLKPLAWFLLLLGDLCFALGDYQKSRVPFWHNLRGYRILTHSRWRAIWPKSTIPKTPSLHA